MAELNFFVQRVAPADARTPLLVLQLFQGETEPQGATAEVDARMGGVIAEALGRGDFKGRADEWLMLYPREGELGADRVLLVGAGKRPEYTVEGLRRAVGTAVRQARSTGVGGLAFTLEHTDRLSEHMGPYHAARAATEATVLGLWQYHELKSEKPETESSPPEQVLIVAANDGQVGPMRDGVRDGAAAARGANLARELATRPANDVTPSYLADVARGIGERHGMEVTVLDRQGIREEGLGGLVAVSQGTEEEPRFIVLEYRHGADDRPPLVLIGKGVTFDSGGISLKPSQKMEEMKYDMSGAAAVLGAMQAIGELELRVNLVAIIPATENLPSGRAIKPGDVIRMHSGRTVEVVNTDAEGRLILADALSYARRFEPAAILDAATLTGSCVVALGNHAIGLMGNDEDFVDEVRAAGERAGERCWELPLWDEYRKQLDSDIADLQNVGGPKAGTITAGWFLRVFAGDVPWAHLDIAGTAWRDEAPPYLRKGATGVPTRLFVEWVRSRAST